MKKGGRPIKKRSHGRRLTNEPCYWGQENFKKLVEECPVDSITLDISTRHLDQGHNPHLNFCVCQLCEELIRRPILATDCEHQFCMNCLFPLLKGVAKKDSKCPICKHELTIDNLKVSKKIQLMTESLQIKCRKNCEILFNIKDIEQLKFHEGICTDTNSSFSSNDSFTSTDIFNLMPDDPVPRNMEDAALHINKIKIAESTSPTIKFLSGGPRLS